MQTVQIHRKVTNLFSLQQLDLTYNQNRFIPFINTAFSLDAFEDIIEEKKKNYLKWQGTQVPNQKSRVSSESQFSVLTRR